MTALKRPRIITIAEYLDGEETGTVKHEYNAIGTGVIALPLHRRQGQAEALFPGGGGWRIAEFLPGTGIQFASIFTLRSLHIPHFESLRLLKIRFHAEFY